MYEYKDGNFVCLKCGFISAGTGGIGTHVSKHKNEKEEYPMSAKEEWEMNVDKIIRLKDAIEYLNGWRDENLRMELGDLVIRQQNLDKLIHETEARKNRTTLARWE